MKKFKAPEAEIVYFESNDIISTSTACECVGCTNCEPGSNDCRTYDFGQ